MVETALQDNCCEEGKHTMAFINEPQHGKRALKYFFKNEIFASYLKRKELVLNKVIKKKMLQKTCHSQYYVIFFVGGNTENG